MILISKTIANDDKMLGNMLTTLITLVIISSATGLDFGFESPVVKVWQGKVLGKEMTSTEGKKFYAFLGIPYGKITKRFKPSENADPWFGTLNGTVDAPVCKQIPFIPNPNDPLVIGTEQCLFINVYVPKKIKLGLYAVLAFIHGGGFFLGSATSTELKPHIIMNNEIILVTFSYRLSGPGFLSTGDTASPGNYGLLDQTLALQWVRNNILFFGGNPAQVTIFGTSAGAGSVIYHLLSPCSAGLFQAAIAQSGSALCPWALRENELEAAQRIAQNLQCPTTPTHDLVSCLRDADIDQLIVESRLAVPNTVTPLTGPVIENKVNGRFITESPLKLLREGHFNKVPLITGVNSDEGVLVAQAIAGAEAMIGLNENSDDVQWEKAISNLLLLPYPYPALTSEDFLNIRQKYFQGADFSDPNDIIWRQAELASDGNFKSCSDETIRLIAAAGVPVYMYVLDQTPVSAFTTQFSGKPDVTHATDLVYLFNWTLFPVYEFSESDIRISKNMADMWTNFAYFHNPTPFKQPVEWKRASSQQIRYLNISAELSMVEGYRTEEMEFWSNIFYDD